MSVRMEIRVPQRSRLKSIITTITWAVIAMGIQWVFFVTYLLHHNESLGTLCADGSIKLEVPQRAPQQEKIAHTTSGAGHKNNEHAVVVLATVPFDERHILALWSELECFVESASHVVLSSAYSAGPIIDRLLSEARNKIPHFASGKITIEARFFDNQRYDAGLWCDALQGLYESGQYDHFLLLNDSIFALRKFNGILDDLRSHNRSMTSLNYNKDENEGDYWYESVFRGFDTHGLSVFRNHSCVPQSHHSFCPHRKRDNMRKKCIIRYHEQGLAKEFSPQDRQGERPKLKGLYDGSVPEHMKQDGDLTNWIMHDTYWKEVLVKEQNFPAAKVGYGVIPNLDDPLLLSCTRYLNRTILNEIDFELVERALNY